MARGRVMVGYPGKNIYIAKLNMSTERGPRRVLSSDAMTSNASRSTSHMASRESSRTLRLIYIQHRAPV
jgi:hypothetical protein